MFYLSNYLPSLIFQVARSAGHPELAGYIGTAIKKATVVSETEDYDDEVVFSFEKEGDDEFETGMFRELAKS